MGNTLLFTTSVIIFVGGLVSVGWKLVQNRYFFIIIKNNSIIILITHRILVLLIIYVYPRYMPCYHQLFRSLGDYVGTSFVIISYFLAVQLIFLPPYNYIHMHVTTTSSPPSPSTNMDADNVGSFYASSHIPIAATHRTVYRSDWYFVDYSTYIGISNNISNCTTTTPSPPSAFTNMAASNAGPFYTSFDIPIGAFCSIVYPYDW